MLTLAAYSTYILSGSAENLYQWSKSFAPYEMREHLGMSKRYLLQYGHLVFLFTLLFLSRYIFIEPRDFPLSEKFISTVAKYTPAVFLFHFPILFFLAAITNYDRTRLLDQVLLLVSVLAISVSLGKICFIIKPAFDKCEAISIKFLTKKYPVKVSIERLPLRLTTVHSKYLNFVKIVSMGAIVFGHFSFREFTNYSLPGFDGSAPRFAVPVFFMLSGYFLMLSIDRCTTDAPVLFFRRFWSLYYLIVPMLLFVPLMDNIGYAEGAQIYQYDDYYVFERERGPLGVPIFLATWINSLLYLNEIWLYTLSGLSDMRGGIVAFSNDPYWFICYLIPYTLLMIVGRMVQGLKKYLIISLICLIIGPPILMLAPLFFAGALAYILHKRIGGPL
ncbi:acyltransferase family protein [Sneathiella marina]|uniref:Acyltransferase family protein n=1 Tax=Sneathiella marina TaxID=2950108 RepID=A0ABY4W863_9PROT|nr:acyltransferase family protein [Sneathiella marina]USG61945.1 acyltransferase family protein [Sneathiella marina]